MISVGIFYVALVLLGFWVPATLLIIVGHWITIADNTTAWQVWSSRALAIGRILLAAALVWRIRVLEQELQLKIDLADSLSRTWRAAGRVAEQCAQTCLYQRNEGKAGGELYRPGRPARLGAGG